MLKRTNIIFNTTSPWNAIIIQLITGQHHRRCIQKKHTKRCVKPEQLSRRFDTKERKFREAQSHGEDLIQSYKGNEAINTSLRTANAGSQRRRRAFIAAAATPGRIWELVDLGGRSSRGDTRGAAPCGRRSWSGCQAASSRAHS